MANRSTAIIVLARWAGILWLVASSVCTHAMRPPQILYTDISSGPNTGGEGNNGSYLSIFGTGFGTDISKTKVLVGDGEVARYAFLGRSLGRSDIQQLSVQLGPKTSTGAVRVIVNGVAAEGVTTFTVRPGDFYFVSSSGSDGRGRVNDPSRPFRTPNYVQGLGGFGRGDFIVVREGRYVLADKDNNIQADSWLRASKSGTADAPIAFVGYPGERVDVQHSRNIRIFSNYVTISNWVVGNFQVSLTDCTGPGEVVLIGPPTTPEVCRDSGGSVGGKATDIKFVNMDIDGHDQFGFCSGGDGLVEIGYSRNVKVIGLALHNTSPARRDESAHAIYLAARQEGTEVGWNTLHHMPATRGVIQAHQDAYWGACWGKKYLTRVRIHHNVLHDLAGQAVLLDGGTGDMLLDNNVIYRNLDYRYNDVVALRGGGGKLNVTMVQNTICADPNVRGTGQLIGIGFSDFPERVALYGNIFCVTSRNDRYIGTEADYSDLQKWLRGGHMRSMNNLWYGAGNGKPSFAGAGELDGPPQFVDEARGDFSLKAASPAWRSADPVPESGVEKWMELTRQLGKPRLGADWF